MGVGVRRCLNIRSNSILCLAVALCVVLGCVSVEGTVEEPPKWKNFSLPGKVPYLADPNLDYFDESRSKSFKNRSEGSDKPQEWFEHFADGSYLFGSQVRDVVWIGHNWSYSHGSDWFKTSENFEFALITGVTQSSSGLDSEWEKLHSGGVDGILGIGCPIANVTQIQNTFMHSLSGPLKDGSHGQVEPMYSIYMSDDQDYDHGFLALGGYVHTDFVEPAWINTIATDGDTPGCRAHVNVRNIYLSQTRFVDPTPSTISCDKSGNDTTSNFVGCKIPPDWTPLFHKINVSKPTPALFDTGASCFYFPRGYNTDGTGNFWRSPLEIYNAKTKGGSGQPEPGDILWFEFEDAQNPNKTLLIKVPWQKYLRANRNDEPCINTAPAATPDLLLLGDPIFRAAQIIFDMKNQRIGVSRSCEDAGKSCEPPDSADPFLVQLRAESVNARFYTAQVYAGTPRESDKAPQGPLSLILDTGSSQVAFFGQPGVSVLPKNPANLTWAVVIGIIALATFVGGIAYYKMRKPPVTDYHLMDAVDDNDEELATARNLTRQQQPRGIPASHLEGVAETAAHGHEASQPPRQAIPPLAAPLQSHPADDIFNQFEDVMLTGRGDGGL